MDQISWMSLIYLMGVLLLISPAIAYVFKAPHALRNATIWLAIIAALGWGYKFFGHMLPEDVAANMQRGGYYADDREKPTPVETSKMSEEDAAADGTTDSATDEDNPIRNQ